MIVLTHSRNRAEDPNHFGILINRTAPGAMLRVTPPVSSLFSPFFIDIIDRH
jgi:hypothetical protein